MPAQSSITGGPLGLNNIPSLTQGWMILLAVAALAFFFYRLRTSRTGYAFAAIREDEAAAQAIVAQACAHFGGIDWRILPSPPDLSDAKVSRPSSEVSSSR